MTMSLTAAAAWWRRGRGGSDGRVDGAADEAEAEGGGASSSSDEVVVMEEERPLPSPPAAAPSPPAAAAAPAAATYFSIVSSSSDSGDGDVDSWQRGLPPPPADAVRPREARRRRGRRRRRGALAVGEPFAGTEEGGSRRHTAGESAAPQRRRRRPVGGAARAAAPPPRRRLRHPRAPSASEEAAAFAASLGLPAGAPILDHYSLTLVVDANEKISQHQRADALCGRLERLGHAVASRRLPVGDFLWVLAPRAPAVGTSSRRASSGTPAGSRDDWLVLDSVVERKQVADFLSTIRSHRHYHSQKVRLGRCGLARRVYLVEGSVERWPHAEERRRMLEELAKIAAVDRLIVHTARDTAETLRFLTTNSRRLHAVVGARSAAELRQARAQRVLRRRLAA